MFSVVHPGNLISSYTNTAYMLEVLSGYDQGAKNSYLTMGLYSKNTATKMDLVAVDSTSYTSLLSNQTRGYEDTFCSARNMKFELGECSCG